MTSETKNKTAETTSDAQINTQPAKDNKAVFRPLGKYALIAVLMVTVIVTTAIMLDKELGTVNQEIAAIESEVKSMVATIDSEIDETVESVTAEAGTETADTETSKPVIEIAATDMKPVESGTITEAKPAVETGQVDTPAVIATDSSKAEITEMAEVSSPSATGSTADFIAEARKQAETRKQQIAAKRLERIETAKAEKKQRIGEVFARIKALEEKQLTSYREDQQSQIEYLRNQVEQQQQMIEALIKRNSDLYELRAAKVQKKQEAREQMLNRI